MLYKVYKNFNVHNVKYPVNKYKNITYENNGDESVHKNAKEKNQVLTKCPVKKKSFKYILKYIDRRRVCFLIQETKSSIALKCRHHMHSHHMSLRWKKVKQVDLMRTI